jgi:glycosyltransferase involved in cell wall biosynthesis
MTERPLRILTVANVPQNPNSGAAGTEYQTIAALRALGHHVDAVWSGAIGRRIAHGNLHQLIELPRGFERVVAERLAAAQYDVAHVNQPHGYRAARLVRRSFPRTVYIHRSHGFEPHAEATLDRWRARYEADGRPLWRRSAANVMRALMLRHSTEILRWADGHIVSSSGDAAFAIERFGLDPQKIAVIPQAAPDAFLQSPAMPMTAERMRTVLFAGQVTFMKAPMITAEAMNRIAARDAEARFVWISARADHDEVRSLLSEEVKARLDLRDWLPQPELIAAYDRAGVFLFPSFYEGFGKVHLEAMSRGMCVVATDLGGMHDVITTGIDGVLVPPGDGEAVADAALALMQDVGRAAAMGMAAATRAREYSWRRVAIETAAFYRRRLAAKTNA